MGGRLFRFWWVIGVLCSAHAVGCSDGAGQVEVHLALPDAALADGEHHIWIRVVHWPESDSAPIATLATNGPVVLGVGLRVAVHDVPYGSDLRVVAVIRRGNDATLHAMWVGVSAPFDIEFGVNSDEVAVSMIPAPGYEPETGLQGPWVFLSSDGGSTTVVPDHLVNLRLEGVADEHVYVANDSSLTLGLQRLHASELIPDGDGLTWPVRWDLNAGLPEELAGLEGIRSVFVQLSSSVGLTSPIQQASVSLDQTSPALLIDTDEGPLGSHVELRVSSSEQLAIPPWVILDGPERIASQPVSVTALHADYEIPADWLPDGAYEVTATGHDLAGNEADPAFESVLVDRSTDNPLVAVCPDIRWLLHDSGCEKGHCLHATLDGDILYFEVSKTDGGEFQNPAVGVQIYRVAPGFATSDEELWDSGCGLDLGSDVGPKGKPLRLVLPPLDLSESLPAVGCTDIYGVLNSPCGFTAQAAFYETGRVRVCGCDPEPIKPCDDPFEIAAPPCPEMASGTEVSCELGNPLAVCGLVETDGSLIIRVQLQDGTSLPTGMYEVREIDTDTPGPAACSDAAKVVAGSHLDADDVGSTWDVPVEPSGCGSQTLCVAWTAEGGDPRWCSSPVTFSSSDGL